MRQSDGFSIHGHDMFGAVIHNRHDSVLGAAFLVPPFSILNAREGWWQERKDAWLSLGIQSEIGRGGSAGVKLTMSDTIQRLKPSADPTATRARNMTAIPGGGTGANSAYKFRTENGYETGLEAQVSGSGTSIFDPVLCELAYRWFSPANGFVLDPFAGGSVRGIVAAKLGRRYVGIDLRTEQIEANRAQAEVLCGIDERPKWIVGDSRHELPDVFADFVFSCPPYADLEVYSDDPRDLSTMDYPEFRKAYAEIIYNSCALLKDDRFACFIVGDARDNKGFYYGLPWHTVDAFGRAGLRLYNEAALVTAIGSLPVRAAKIFEASRKLGKTHQNMLVFVKGCPERATKACRSGN